MATAEFARLTELIEDGAGLARQRPTVVSYPSEVTATMESEAKCFGWFHKAIGWIQRNFPGNDAVLAEFKQLNQRHELRNAAHTVIGRVEFLRRDMLKMVAYLEALKDRTEEVPQPAKSEMQFALLHPRIREVSEGLFRDEHYAQAVLEAYKVVNRAVKVRVPDREIDGTALMSHAFNAVHPVVRLTPCQTKSERDEQEGFMHLYMGAMLGIRNPKAHDQVVQKDPVKTFEYLAFASLLLRRLEEAYSETDKSARPVDPS